ncbi:MAG: type IV pilus assembly protein PilM [candidate division Zixibacteria bacterium]|jgi:type IV pilus assembly protein PilM|nr:type IV pilus assembly protein PilM [candidate division Zixibacteria bacterium]
MAFGKRVKLAAGLDIGANSIKLVKLARKGSGYSLKALAIKELPMGVINAEEIKDRDAVIFDIQSLVDQTDPKLKDVVVGISGHGVITDKLIMDRKTGTEAEQAILFEAEQRAPFDVEDVTLDYHIIKEDVETNKMEVLMVAARNEFLKNYIDLIIDAGLKPVIVDTDAFAILNAYDVNYDIDPSRIIALIDLGLDNTTMTFIKDGLYHSTRDVSNGTRLIFDAVSKEFRLNQELTAKSLRGEMDSSIDQDMFKATVVTASEELIAGLEVAMSYFKSSSGADRLDLIVLSGGGALIPFLPEVLQMKLSIPVEIFNPLRNIEYDPDMFVEFQPEKVAPLLAVAIGLAARRV